MTEASPLSAPLASISPSEAAVGPRWPCCFSVRQWVSPAQLRLAAFYATLWSTPPEGLALLGEHSRSDAPGRAKLGGRWPLGTPPLATYQEYREVLEVLLKNAAAGAGGGEGETERTESNTTTPLVALQQSYGFARGNALYRTYILTPQLHMQRTVAALSNAVQELYLQPYWCGVVRAGDPRTCRPLCLQDFDIHVQWAPSSPPPSEGLDMAAPSRPGVVGRGQTSSSTSSSHYSFWGGTVAATITVRYAPQLRERELALRLAELSLLSARAAGQSLSSSLLFWESVQDGASSGPAQKTAAAAAALRGRGGGENNSKTSRNQKNDGKESSAEKSDSTADTCVRQETTTQPLGPSSTPASPSHPTRDMLELQQRLAAVQAIPLPPPPPLTRLVPREQLMEMNEEDFDFSSEEEEEEEMTWAGASAGVGSKRHREGSGGSPAQRRRNEHLIRIPVVTSLPPSCEAVCGAAVPLRCTGARGCTSRGPMAEDLHAQRIWQRVQQMAQEECLGRSEAPNEGPRHSLLAAAAVRQLHSTPEEARKKEKKEDLANVGHVEEVERRRVSDALRVSVLGSWRSVASSQRYRIGRLGSASNGGGGGAAMEHNSTDAPVPSVPPSSRQMGGAEITEAVARKILMQQRRDWERAVQRSRSHLVAPPPSAEPPLQDTGRGAEARAWKLKCSRHGPVWTQPDDQLALILHRDLQRAVEALEAHGQPAGTGKRPHSRQHLGPPRYPGSTAFRWTSASGQSSPPVRSRCGLVAHLTLTTDGIVYVGYPFPELVSEDWAEEEEETNESRGDAGKEDPSCKAEGIAPCATILGAARGAGPPTNASTTPVEAMMLSDEAAAPPSPTLASCTAYGRLRLEDPKSFTRGLLGFS